MAGTFSLSEPTIDPPNLGGISFLHKNRLQSKPYKHDGPGPPAGKSRGGGVRSLTPAHPDPPQKIANCSNTKAWSTAGGGQYLRLVKAGQLPPPCSRVLLLPLGAPPRPAPAMLYNVFHETAKRQ